MNLMKIILALLAATILSNDLFGQTRTGRVPFDSGSPFWDSYLEVITRLDEFQSEQLDTINQGYLDLRNHVTEQANAHFENCRNAHRPNGSTELKFPDGYQNCLNSSPKIPEQPANWSNATVEVFQLKRELAYRHFEAEHNQNVMLNSPADIRPAGLQLNSAGFLSLNTADAHPELTTIIEELNEQLGILKNQSEAIHREAFDHTDDLTQQYFNAISGTYQSLIQDTNAQINGAIQEISQYEDLLPPEESNQITDPTVLGDLNVLEEELNEQIEASHELLDVLRNGTFDINGEEVNIHEVFGNSNGLVRELSPWIENLIERSEVLAYEEIEAEITELGERIQDLNEFNWALDRTIGRSADLVERISEGRQEAEDIMSGFENVDTTSSRYLRIMSSASQLEEISLDIETWNSDLLTNSMNMFRAVEEARSLHEWIIIEREIGRDFDLSQTLQTILNNINRVDSDQEVADRLGYHRTIHNIEFYLDGSSPESIVYNLSEDFASFRTESDNNAPFSGSIPALTLLFLSSVFLRAKRNQGP